MDQKLRVVFSVNEADLKRFNDLLAQANINADKLDDNLKDVEKTSGASFDTASKGVNTLVNGVKAFLALEAVNYLKNMAVEASKVAAAGEGIRSAFANLGGSASDLKQLSDAVGGTVSNIKLMEFAVKAMQKGMNMDQVAKTLAYLDKQADATGASFETLAQKAIKGMTDIPAYMDEVTKKTEELGEVTADAGDAYDKLAASQANLQEAFGRIVNSSGFLQLKSFVANELNQLADFLNDPSGFDRKFGGMSVEQLEKEIIASRQRTAEIDKKYAEGGSAFRLANLRDELDEEKQLRMDLIIQQQKAFKTQQDLEKKGAKELAAAEMALLDQQHKDELEKEKALAAEKLRIQLEARRQLNIQGAQLDAQFKANAEDSLAVKLSGAEAGLFDAMNANKEGLPSINPDELLDPEIADEIPKLTAPIEKSAENAEISFNSMLTSTFQIVSLFESLSKEDSGPSQFLSKLLKGAGVLLSLFPGAQPAGLIFSSLGSIAGMFNEGGKIPGSGPDRDSVLIGATPGEYMINRMATKRSSLMLDAINAGELDDKLFTKLTNTPVINLNQAQVVEAIKQMPQTDFYKVGSILFETRMDAYSKRMTRKQRMVL